MLCLDIDLYGSETWTVRKLEQKCLKIKWLEKITNEIVLECIGEKRTL